MRIVEGLPSKLYVDQQGKIIGWFAGHIVHEPINGEIVSTVFPEIPPQGGIHVEAVPESGDQIYDFNTKTFLPLENI